MRFEDKSKVVHYEISVMIAYCEFIFYSAVCEAWFTQCNPTMLLGFGLCSVYCSICLCEHNETSCFAGSKARH